MELQSASPATPLDNIVLTGHLDDAQLREQVLDLYRKHTASRVVGILNAVGVEITEPMLNKRLRKWNAEKKSDYPKTRRQRKKCPMSKYARTRALTLALASPSRPPTVCPEDRELFTMLSTLGHWYDNEFETTYRSQEIPMREDDKTSQILYEFDEALAHIWFGPWMSGWKGLQRCGERSIDLFNGMNLWTPWFLFKFLTHWRRNRSSAVAELVETLLWNQCGWILGANHPLSLLISNARKRQENAHVLYQILALIQRKLISRASPEAVVYINREIQYQHAQMYYDWNQYDKAITLLYTLIQDHPKQAFRSDCASLLAGVKERQGDLCAAIAVLSKDMETLSPEKPGHVNQLARALSLRGRYYLGSNEPILAEDDFREGLALAAERGTDLTTWLVTDLLVALEKQKKFDEADEIRQQYSHVLE